MSFPDTVQNTGASGAPSFQAPGGFSAPAAFGGEPPRKKPVTAPETMTQDTAAPAAVYGTPPAAPPAPVYEAPPAVPSAPVYPVQTACNPLPTATAAPTYEAPPAAPPAPVYDPPQTVPVPPAAPAAQPAPRAEYAAPAAKKPASHLWYWVGLGIFVLILAGLLAWVIASGGIGSRRSSRREKGVHSVVDEDASGDPDGFGDEGDPDGFGDGEEGSIR